MAGAPVIPYFKVPLAPGDSARETTPTAQPGRAQIKGFTGIDGYASGANLSEAACVLTGNAPIARSTDSDLNQITALLARPETPSDIACVTTKITRKFQELKEYRPIVARALADSAAMVIESGSSDAAAKLNDLVQRADQVAKTFKNATGPFRRSLPLSEQQRRAEAVFDTSRPADTVLASFPPKPAVVELPRSSPVGEAQRQLDAEPKEIRDERAESLIEYDRRPFYALQHWAVEGDKFVRKITRESSLAEGLSFADIDKARPMQFFRDFAAKVGPPDIDLRATGVVQSFEAPPIDNIPSIEVQAVLPRPFIPGRPTIVYLSEATSSPFDAKGKPTGTIGEFLGRDLAGLGDVNVVLMRSPYQAEFPNGPRFTAGYDNVQASLALTTQYMDHLVQKLRAEKSGPVIMGGYSLGGAHINQYRGWFDDGTEKAGADFYIPIAAPSGGYGALFDRTTNEGKPTWWSASQLSPEAYKQQDRVARELSPTADELQRSDRKVFALIPRWDEAIQGIDEQYTKRSRTIPGGHISGAVETFVPLTVSAFGTNVTIPNWPAMGTVTRTHQYFRDAVEAFVEHRPQNTWPGF